MGDLWETKKTVYDYQESIKPMGGYIDSPSDVDLEEVGTAVDCLVVPSSNSAAIKINT